MSETLTDSRRARSAQAAPFLVAEVEKTDAPDGSGESGWYRYILDNGRSRISGLRRGTLKEVSAYAAHCAEQINARGLGRQSHWAPRGRKPAAASSNNNT